MKKLLVLLLALALVFAFAACGSQPADEATDDTAADTGEESVADDTVYTLKIGSTVQDDSATGIALYEYFEKYIEENSDGRIQVEVYNNSTLGDDNTLFQQLQTNAVQASCGPLNVLANFEPNFAAADLPYLFRNKETAYAALDGAFGDMLKENLPNIGMRILGYGENAFRQVSSSVKPITSLEDLQGLKIRVMDAPAHIATWEALGTNPTPIAFSELYNSLKQGLVDAQDNGVVLFYTSKLYEVQKYYTISQQCYAAWAIVLSETFWQSLPEDLQQVVQDGATYCCTEQRKLNTQMEEELLAQMQSEYGLEVNYIEGDELLRWQEATKPAWDVIAELVTPEVMEAAYAVDETYGVD